MVSLPHSQTLFGNGSFIQHTQRRKDAKEKKYVPLIPKLCLGMEYVIACRQVNTDLSGEAISIKK
jgi:hypothetical protein